MDLLSLFLLAVGVSMDAFAVSMCKGLAMKTVEIKHCLIVGLWFGGFQALMPTIGFLLGRNFTKYITGCDHWIAFFLLLLIGANMIKEALSKDDTREEEAEESSSLGFKIMLLLAIATSIDALAVGVNFAFLTDTNVPMAIIFIGCTTFMFSAFGIKIGSVFGTKFKSGSEIFGGIILILIGVKILLEHLGIINF